jgi:hypothetical protein
LSPPPVSRLGCLSSLPMDSENIVVWNVCGLSGGARRDVVTDLVRQERCSLLCVQETKLSNIDDGLVASMLGSNFRYSFLPANVTRGGILVAWDIATWSVLASLSVKVKLACTSAPEENCDIHVTKTLRHFH